VQKHSSVTNDVLTAKLWLIFRRDGTVRMTRNEPDLSRDERAVALTAKLPLALFRVPLLTAVLTVDTPEFPPQLIDIAAAGEALKSALGVDIDVRVREVE
jgi:hypothetical protein